MDKPDNIRTNVHLFGNVEFKEAGVYHVEVNVDDVLKLRYPFPVMLMPPQKTATTARRSRRKLIPPWSRKNPHHPPKRLKLRNARRWRKTLRLLRASF